MKIKIVNLPKFIFSIILIITIILTISLFTGNKTFSHGNVSYKKIYVSNGDTLWKIAEELKETNSYYKDKETRQIIDNLKEINYLNNSSLSIGQELVVCEI